MPNHDLTGELAIREAFDVTTGALKTVPSGSTSFQIELSHTDGDTIETHPSSFVAIDAAAVNCFGIKSINLYMMPGAAASAKVQVSPADSGDIWIDVPTSTVANDPTNVTMSGVLSICARRLRVVTVSGTPSFYCVLQGV